jgi:hypothetical protein
LKKYCRKVSFTIIFLFPWLLLLLRHVICKLSVPRSTLHMLHHYQRINILELINLFKLTTVTISCAKFCYIFTVISLIKLNPLLKIVDYCLHVIHAIISQSNVLHPYFTLIEQLEPNHWIRSVVLRFE